jgi:NACHT domain
MDFFVLRPDPPPPRWQQRHLAHKYTVIDRVMAVGIYMTHDRYIGPTTDEIDRACLRDLLCPDSLAVKNRLKENKDKLLHRSFDWIFHVPEYIRWQDGDDVGLLWIKGGAGKGKTMMSIGLIEALSQRRKETTTVTYFFCQNADYELNTIEAIIKGLILQLVEKHPQLKQSLRKRWDTTNERFSEDVHSWRGLWTILTEILDGCTCPRVYLVVDALDECIDSGMAELLRLVVRTGLDRPSRVKWLVTSRPLDSAEQELLASSDQVRVSLELNSSHISEGVRIYVKHKVAELDRRCHYGPARRLEVENELLQKAEETFLWVNLVCKRLEAVDREEALTIIQDLPPGLTPFYDRILTQICNGEPSVVQGCVRLLKVMMATYRPLDIREWSSVTDLLDDPWYVQQMIERCASFVTMRENKVNFIHQSTRDYLAGTSGRRVLDSHHRYDDAEIAEHCLAHLCRRLKTNLLDLARLDSSRESLDEHQKELLISLDYATTFWFKHLSLAKDDGFLQCALGDQGDVAAFLRTRFLEWLECLSWLDELPRAIEALETMADLSSHITCVSPTITHSRQCAIFS